MNGIGIVDHSAFLCDSCGKRIPAKGVRMNMEEQGEYQVSYFTCPHCGRVYQITTTDQKQREMLEEQKKIRRKLTTAVGMNFRRETVRKYKKQLQKLGKDLEKRAVSLKVIGEGILHPEKGGGADDGQGDSESGTESV